jgi:phosphoribosyl 1,2-cyclic phosphodiesterase
MKALVLGSCCSIHFPREGCDCPSCKDPIFAKRRNASLLIKDIMLDAGEDFRGKIPSEVKKIILTHGHPDHSFGVKGFDGELYMSHITFNFLLRHHIVPEGGVNVLDYGDTIDVSGYPVTLFPILHSSIAPASSIKIGKLLYCPDIKELLSKNKVLEGVTTYIGDGSALKKDISYRVGIGHAAILHQLEWVKGRVEKVYFTHIGHIRMSHKQVNEYLFHVNESEYHFKEIRVLKEGDIISI